MAGPDETAPQPGPKPRGLIPMWITVVVLNGCIIGVALHFAGFFRSSIWTSMFSPVAAGKPGRQASELKATAGAEPAIRDIVEREEPPAPGVDARIADLEAAEGAESPNPPNDVELTTREIVERAEPSIARVEGRLSMGTGFLIGDGLLITNAHVVDGENMVDLSVRFPSAEKRSQGPYQPRRLLFDDQKRDIAVLLLEDCPLPPLETAKSYAFQRGDDVTIIGSPGLGDGVSLQNAITKGVLSTEANIEGLEYYQLGASVNPGNSGGPVLANNGKVIGMISSKANKAEAVGFCIPVKDLLGAVEATEDLTPQQITRVELRHSARAAYTRLVKVGRIYAIYVAVYADVVDEAIERRENIQPRILFVIKDCSPKAKSFHESMNELVKPFLFDIVNNDQLLEGVRRDLQELWSVCSDMKDFIVLPKEPFNQYRNRTRELRSRFDHLVEKLSIPLGEVK